MKKKNVLLRRREYEVDDNNDKVAAESTSKSICLLFGPLAFFRRRMRILYSPKDKGRVD